MTTTGRLLPTGPSLPGSPRSFPPPPIRVLTSPSPQSVRSAVAAVLARGGGVLWDTWPPGHTLDPCRGPQPSRCPGLQPTHVFCHLETRFKSPLSRVLPCAGWTEGRRSSPRSGVAESQWISPRGGGGMRSEKHAPGFRGAFKLQGAGARGLLPPPPPLPSSPSPLFLITFLLA